MNLGRQKISSCAVQAGNEGGARLVSMSCSVKPLYCAIHVYAQNTAETRAGLIRSVESAFRNDTTPALPIHQPSATGALTISATWVSSSDSDAPRRSQMCLSPETVCRCRFSTASDLSFERLNLTCYFKSKKICSRPTTTEKEHGIDDVECLSKLDSITLRNGQPTVFQHSCGWSVGRTRQQA